MMFLAGLAVVFAGLLGGKGNVDAQLKRVLRDLHVEVKALPAAKLRSLTRHTAETRDLVRDMHADGVIACEIVHGKTLRLVIYEGDGTLKTFTELPLSRRGLTAQDLRVLRQNLRGEVIALRDSSDIAPPTSSRSAPASSAAARRGSAPASANVDDEDPLGGESASTGQEATAVASADDAASDDELDGLAADKKSGPAAAKRAVPWFGVSAGLGVATRSFAPGTSMVTPYTSTPVPTIAVDAYVQPARQLRIQVGTERTLRLSTEMADGSSAPTTIARWHASVDYAFVQGGAIAFAARLGGGRRSFVIDTVDPNRSPDRGYNYAVAGFAASAHIGHRLVLLASAAFEPVLVADASPAMAPGESGRWALDVGGGLEVRASSHVFVRAAASYQRFSWSWLISGTGIASDAYPAGTLSLGADY